MRVKSTFGAASMVAFTVVQLAAANNDENAGKWKMIVLTGPDQIQVPPPAPVTDDGYLGELAAIKSAQAHLTTAQRNAIAYWSSGGALRWNQILLELVAASDLPPEPNADGSYTFPSAATPFAFPQFPFANPPYAARSYSYVAVAQFEALKAAWYYKYLYNRPAPPHIDGGIQALMPNNGIPSYPSEDAVESGVSVALLSVLFPTAVDLIKQKAAEQQQAAMLSGKAASSDIAAGFALGQAVAAVFISRAGSDGLKVATGTAPQWQALADAATARGEIPWKSLENPPRPPMLPFFGQVKAWMMTPSDIANERPAPPPSTSSSEMARQTAEVKSTIQHLSRAELAIATKWADGVSSPTPPGHWNFIAETYIANAQFSEVRAARAFALLDMALHDAAIACWETKYFYFTPRPEQMDPTIKTVIGLPNFPSYTSGHSTFSGAADVVLTYLFPSGKSYFDAQAQEAAISRLYGGIHYRVDNEAGLSHGTRIGGYTLKFALNDGADQPANVSASSGQALDGASYHSPVAPGSIATVFQPNLSTLTSMTFNGSVSAPVLAAAPSQANIQIPWEMQGLNSATLTATAADGSTTSFPVSLSAQAPAIFSVNQQGTGPGAVTIGDTTTVTTPARPATKGDVITIACIGLGPVNNTPATGVATPDNTSTVISPVTVQLDDISLPAQSARLTPGRVGLYQVTVQIPDDAPTGNAIPLAISVGGVTSNTVTIAIQ